MKEAYTTLEIMLLLCLVKTSVLRRAKRENWKWCKREGKGGGKEWLVASMPQETRLAIQTAEARRAVEQEQAHLPVPLDSDLLGPMASAPIASMHPDYNRLIFEDSRRNKALAKADIVRLYMDWQRKHGCTVEQKKSFVFAYLGGTWPKLLAELGQLSWKSLENWKLAHSRAGNVLAAFR